MSGDWHLIYKGKNVKELFGGGHGGDLTKEAFPSICWNIEVTVEDKAR